MYSVVSTSYKHNMKKTTRLFLLIICMIAFGLMALGSTSSDESKDADNASAKKNVTASKTPTVAASKKATQAETKKNDDTEVADNIERGPIDLDAVVPKKLDVIITNGHFIGDVLTAEDFTITVEMSDGSVLTNPAGWGATPLALNAESNEILVAYDILNTVVIVPATARLVETQPPVIDNPAVVDNPATNQPAVSPEPKTPWGGGGGSYVWIPTNGGSRYHSKKTCSGMIDPEYVTLEEAYERGFTVACGRCY